MVFPTGQYEATLFLTGRTFPVEVTLSRGLAPSWNKRGEIVHTQPTSNGIDQGGLRAQLSNGGHAIFFDAEFAFRDGTATPDQGTAALVSWEDFDPSSGSRSITFQISGLDPLIGESPLEPPLFEEAASRYVISDNPRSIHSWTEEGMQLICRYGSSIVLNNRHRLDACFWPEFTLVSTESLPISEWIKLWVRPLLDLVSFLTRAPQHVTTLKAEFPSAAGDALAWAQLFQAGITQDPYRAEDTWEVERQNRTPTLRLGELPMTLPELIARWRDLEADFGVVIDLYQASVLRSDISPRAKFLFLVQALEALQTQENRSLETEEIERHLELRATLFEAFANCSTSTRELKMFLKKNVGKRPTGSLEKRLRVLSEQLPRQAAEICVNRGMKAVTFEEQDLGLEKRIAILRNDLSHGNRAVEPNAVAAWAECLFTLCHGHLLRVLGFGSHEVVLGLSRVYHARQDFI